MGCGASLPVHTNDLKPVPNGGLAIPPSPSSLRFPDDSSLNMTSPRATTGSLSQLSSPNGSSAHIDTSTTTTPDFLEHPLPSGGNVDSEETPMQNALDQTEFRPFRIVRIKQHSARVKEFVFEAPAGERFFIPVGCHVSVRVTLNGSPTIRSYTPLFRPYPQATLHLVVKCYNTKRVSEYLHSLSVGDTVEICGPKTTNIEESISKFDVFGMVAGGTGIMPLLQIISGILNDTTSKKTVHLLFANSTEQEILLRDELESLAARFPDRFRVHYLVSRPPPNWPLMLRGKISKDILREFLPGPSSTTLMLDVGPLGFCVNAKNYLLALGHSPENVRVL